MSDPASRFRSLCDLDQLGHEAVMSKLADSTRKAYTTGWKQWTMFMSGTGRPPFLTGETRPEKQADEAWLIRFVVFLHEVMGRTAQGIKQPLGHPICLHCDWACRSTARTRAFVGQSAGFSQVGECSGKEGSGYPCHVRLDKAVPESERAC